MTNGELIVLIYKALPYSDQIDSLNIMDINGGVSLDLEWRGTRFLISKYESSTNFSVGEYDGICTVGNDKSLLLSRLLSLTFIREDLNK